MKTSHIAAAALLLGGLLSLPALATTPAAHYQATAALKLDLPVPAKVVSLTDLPRTFAGETVMISLTIDETGRPHDIKVLSRRDRLFTRSVVTALSQWQFIPARLNGTPVSVKALLPLEIREA